MSDEEEEVKAEMERFEAEETQQENDFALMESSYSPIAENEPNPEIGDKQINGEVTEPVESQDVAVDTAVTEKSVDIPPAIDANAQSVEDWNASFQRVYEKSLRAKEEGTAFYKAQQFMSAKVKYAEAMGSVQVSNIRFILLQSTNSYFSLLSWNRTKMETSPMSSVP